MDNKLTLVVLASLSFVFYSSGQGSESFTNCNASGTTYTDGSYIGDNGAVWTYGEARLVNTTYNITGSSIGFSTTSARFVSALSGPNGVGYLYYNVRSYFTSGAASDRRIDVYVNGILYDSYTLEAMNTIYNRSILVNETGNVTIEFRSIGTLQIVLDDISWTKASTATVDYGNLQFPQNGNTNIGNSFDIYAQVYELGVTESSGPGTGILAWIGYHTINNNPKTIGWTWVPATFNSQVNNNDEFVANIGAALPSGTYYYASRFQIDDGPYSYGGYSTTGGGFWNGTTNVSGILSVDTVDFCNLQFPGAGSINLGDPFAVYGQVFEQLVTPGTGQGAGIVAEIGYSTSNSNPNTWSNWIPGTYNAACSNCNSEQNDEYSANLGGSITAPGIYYFATRFKLNGGIWLYGGILPDGTAGGFWNGTTYISGILQVLAPEIRVESNSGTFPEIISGDTTPQGTDNTLFLAQLIGATQSKSYRIRNQGNLDLTLSGVTITGANPTDFTITITPASSISPSTFSILEIQFSPLAAGARNATVSIPNNDSNENPYTFAIRGTGICVASALMINPTSGPSGTVATIIGENFGALTTAKINGVSMPIALIDPSTIEVSIPFGAVTGTIVIVNNISCTSTVPFKVVDQKIGGCEGSAFLSDLFISEVTDATIGGLSYIEIYNGTGSSKPMGDYSIGIYNNGAATPTNTVPLIEFALPNNSTYVLALGIAGTPSIGNTCPQSGGDGQSANQKSTIVGVNKKDNEHDVIRLLKSSGSVVVDEFGIYMSKNWMDATIITGDRGFNFRRLNTASLLPNPNFNLADWNVIDWVGAGAGSCHTNDYSDIGSYDFSSGTPPIVHLQPLPPLTSCKLAQTLNVLAVEGLDNGLPLAHQWYYNAPGTSDWVEIVATNPLYTGQQTENLSILNTLDLNGYQFYVQIRENLETCYTASQAIRLKIEKTIWNGSSWSPTLPNSNTIAVLGENYTTSSITGSFSACSLIVNSGYNLNITDHHYVEIINDVLVNGTSPSNFGEIMVETKGAFIQRGDAAAAGTFKLASTGTSRVKKQTALKQKWYDYTYFSSPVLNETVESALSMASSSRRFYYEAANYFDGNSDGIDDNGDDWQLATGIMIPGRGYAATSGITGLPFPRIDATVFNGEFNTGDIPVTIHTNAITTDIDWNFIGNPYPSGIDFKLVHSANMTVIDGAAYLWSHYSPPLASNPGNQVLNFNGADYAIITTGSGNTAGASGILPSDFIPSAQGFFVIGINSGGEFNFKNSMRMVDASSNSQFFRSETQDVPNKFWINLTSDNGVFNQILVAYVEGATDGFDGFAFDAERNLSSGLSSIIYTQIPERTKKYAIQGKAPQSLSLDEEVALGFYTTITQPTLYNLSVAKIQGAFFDEQKVYLKDNLLNIDHDLSSADYRFTSSTGDFEDRFVIVFRNQTLTVDESVIGTNDLTILELSNGQVQFSIGQQCAIKSVEIMDVLGRTLYHLKGSLSTEIYDLSNLSKAAYIAKVKLTNGQTIIKRAIKRF
ncbi:Lamin Tail Domain [Gelidibacter algens]|uniref:Lamin Tail Domain n=1 Tax=Gelidibacter algens TaxID=49280 RepID=A0A1A7R2M9_9FLAO|nr:choice-of-anchor D domain-containing protein [Gelidibacter algens]OBX26086.1 hypothetical protein A9996_06020 [Gelidibacter algens]RAJ22956.1 Lamin Tail Domain [Gelidibacter algens]